MRWTRWVLVASLLLAGTVACVTSADSPPPDTGKLSWNLYVAAEDVQPRSQIPGQDPGIVSALLIVEGRVTDSMLSILAGAGYTLLGSFGSFIAVEAPRSVYTSSTVGIDSLDFVTDADLSPAPIRNLQQGAPYDPAHLTASLQGMGRTGVGTNIAVIDEGFVIGHRALVGIEREHLLVQQSSGQSGEYSVIEQRVGTESLHGTYCAMTVAALAPDASFYLLSYPPGAGVVGWLSALDYAVRVLGVDVVTSSVEFTRPFCHADGRGLLNREVGGILSGSSTMLVMAAGNWGGGSGTGASFYAGSFADADRDFRHDFTRQGSDSWDRNSLRIAAHQGDELVIILEWDDWDVIPRRHDLSLLLYESEKGTRVATSQTYQLGRTAAPAEILSVVLPLDCEYELVVEDTGARWFGASHASVPFHLYLLNRTSRFESVEHQTPVGSVREVATNPAVIAVGAVSPSTMEPRPYSSCGISAVGGSKPDFYAPDGLRDPFTGVTFKGTSAAAPYVAGAALLARSVAPSLQESQIIALLRDTAQSFVDGCGREAHAVDPLEAMLRLAAAER